MAIFFLIGVFFLEDDLGFLTFLIGEGVGDFFLVVDFFLTREEVRVGFFAVIFCVFFNAVDKI